MRRHYNKLKIKAAVGIERANQEIELSEKRRVAMPLRGIKGEAICVSLTHELVSKKNKARDIILLDAYHSATIEGARTTVDNVKMNQKPEVYIVMEWLLLEVNQK